MLRGSAIWHKNRSDAGGLTVVESYPTEQRMGYVDTVKLTAVRNTIMLKTSYGHLCFRIRDMSLRYIELEGHQGPNSY
jgi:hypothetical protein